MRTTKYNSELCGPFTSMYVKYIDHKDYSSVCNENEEIDISVPNILTNNIFAVRRYELW